MEKSGCTIEVKFEVRERKWSGGIGNVKEVGVTCRVEMGKVVL